MTTKTEPMPIELAVAENPAIVLMDESKRKELFAHIRQEVEAFEPDLSTVTGRKAVASLAHKVTRTKTAIDDAGKQLNATLRKQIDTVDASRRIVRAELDDLRDKARKPLTDWEDAEKRRQEECLSILSEIRRHGEVGIDDTSETIAERLDYLRAVKLPDELFGDNIDNARGELLNAVRSLELGMERAKKAEAEAAELERLRKEAEARAEAERAAKEKAEAEKREAERIAAEKAKAEAAKKAEAERIAKAKEEAAEQARKEAERKHAEEVAKLKAEKEAAEAKQRAEAEKAIKEKYEREAKAKRKAEEDAERAADKKHRKAVLDAASEAIVEFGKVDDETARRIVLAITGGNIPGVEIKF